MKKLLDLPIFVLGVGLAIFAIYVAGYGSFKPSIFRGGTVLVSMLLAGLWMIRKDLQDEKPISAAVSAIRADRAASLTKGGRFAAGEYQPGEFIVTRGRNVEDA